MHIIVMPNHVVPSCVRLIATRYRAGVVLLPIVSRHVSIKVLLPKETSAAGLALEGSVVRSSVAFFVVSRGC